MANVFKLDDIRAEAERRYTPTQIELEDGTVVELRALLRLGKKERSEVLATVDEINGLQDEDEDDDTAAGKVADIVAKIIETVATKPKKLLEALDHEDPAVRAHLHMQVLSAWMGNTQLGEAESSPA